MLKKIKHEIDWWITDSKFLDWLEEYLIYNKFKKLHKIGMKLWGYRMGD